MKKTLKMPLGEDFQHFRKRTKNTQTKNKIIGYAVVDLVAPS